MRPHFLRRAPLRRLSGIALLCLLATLSTAGTAACGPATDEHHDDHDAHDDHGEGEEHAEDGGLVTLAPEALERIGLTTAPVGSTPVEGSRETTGQVGYDERLLAHVTPRLGGRLTRVAAELGETVSEGQVLAVVDSVELGQARALYQRSLARLNLAQTHFDRVRSLRNQGIVSDQEVLEAEAHAAQERADLEASRESLLLYGLSGREIDQLGGGGADGDGARFSVRSPLGGTVVAKDAVRGELVEPERELFTVADLSRVWIWIDVYERQLRDVAVGDTVQVRLDAYPDADLEGRVSYLGSEVDPRTRTVRGRIDVANRRDLPLRPGMFARIRLASSSPEGDGPRRLTVPAGALQRHEGGQVVFVALAPDPDDEAGHRRFERRAVRVGEREGGQVEILAGLEPGEQVVVDGAFLLKSQAASDQLGGGHHH